MKSTFLVLATTLVLFSTTLTAASGDTNARFINIYAGAGISARAGLNTKVATGFKSDVSFNSIPDFEAAFLIAFGKRNNIGFGLDIGMNSVSYVSKPEVSVPGVTVTDSNTITERYSYMGLFPHLYFSGFVVGVNFGVPLSGTTRSKAGDDVSVIAQLPFAETQHMDPPIVGKIPQRPLIKYEDYLASLVELKIGGRLPVSDDPLGRLNVDVFATYSISHLFTEGRNYYGAYANTGNTIIFDESTNPVPITISLGVSYQFCIAIAIGH